MLFVTIIVCNPGMQSSKSAVVNEASMQRQKLKRKRSAQKEGLDKNDCDNQEGTAKHACQPTYTGDCPTRIVSRIRSRAHSPTYHGWPGSSQEGTAASHDDHSGCTVRYIGDRRLGPSAGLSGNRPGRLDLTTATCKRQRAQSLAVLEMSDRLRTLSTCTQNEMK